MDTDDLNGNSIEEDRNMDTADLNGNSIPQAIDLTACPDVIMKSIDLIASDDVKQKSATTSIIDTTITETHINSLIGLPKLLENILYIVQCTVLQDTMTHPVHAKYSFLYN